MVTFFLAVVTWTAVAPCRNLLSVSAAQTAVVLRIPRNDVQATNALGMVVLPAMGLCSTVSVERRAGRTMATVDFCLLSREVNPAIDELRRLGMAIESLTSRFVDIRPDLRFLKAKGILPVTADDRGATKAYAILSGIIGNIASPSMTPPRGSIVRVPWDRLNRIFAGRGTIEDLVVHRYFARDGLRSDSESAFYACPCGKTMVYGSVATKPATLERTLDVLRSSQIELDAIQPQGSDAGSTITFHGEGDAVLLATCVKQAWDVGLSRTR